MIDIKSINKIVLIHIIMISKYLLAIVIKLLILTALSKFTQVIRINKTHPSLQALNSSCTAVGYNN
jgi:hypothetical protein